jgi:BlaI family transcriptional regulator, penicillinase repressor
MARRSSPTLTDAELRLMEVLWDKGAATVGDVVDSLPKRDGVAYSTVLTTLRILEKKGYLRHVKAGRAFVYEPVVGRDQARRSTIRHLVSRYFEGSHGSLVLNILENEDLTGEEMEQLRRKIRRKESS